MPTCAHVLRGDRIVHFLPQIREPDPVGSRCQRFPLARACVCSLTDACTPTAVVVAILWMLFSPGLRGAGRLRVALALSSPTLRERPPGVSSLTSDPS